MDSAHTLLVMREVEEEEGSTWERLHLLSSFIALHCTLLSSLHQLIWFLISWKEKSRHRLGS